MPQFDPASLRIDDLQLYYIPVETRVPLKFGSETLSRVNCARCCISLVDAGGRRASGWGETPLSVQWVWPSSLGYTIREERLKQFCLQLAAALPGRSIHGHPIRAAQRFETEILKKLHAEEGMKTDSRSATRWQNEKTDLPCDGNLPWLAALVCFSLFDIAIHDAFANYLERPAYHCYGADLLAEDLTEFLASESTSFVGQRPADYLADQPLTRLPAWHLVGGLDPLTAADLDGSEPHDGYPVTLEQWIERDQLNCLKIKLRGMDAAWDLDRLRAVGKISARYQVEYLTADFNCTVTDPEYVNGIMDRLKADDPELFARFAYIEQPFPYELEAHQIDVHSVSERLPLFLDESAHDWRLVRLGLELGWTGVALKTCKTQSGALLSACWAQAHGMQLMVQDLTNPMLAQIPHVQLAAHLPTLMGVETNSMQFYPEASAPEAVVHPGLYRRRGGNLDLRSLGETGFGYRVEAIGRVLPAPVFET